MGELVLQNSVCFPVAHQVRPSKDALRHFGGDDPTEPARGELLHRIAWKLRHWTWHLSSSQLEGNLDKSLCLELGKLHMRDVRTLRHQSQALQPSDLQTNSRELNHQLRKRSSHDSTDFRG